MVVRVYFSKSLLVPEVECHVSCSIEILDTNILFGHGAFRIEVNARAGG